MSRRRTKVSLWIDYESLLLGAERKVEGAPGWSGRRYPLLFTNYSSTTNALTLFLNQSKKQIGVAVKQDEAVLAKLEDTQLLVLLPAYLLSQPIEYEEIRKKLRACLCSGVFLDRWACLFYEEMGGSINLCVYTAGDLEKLQAVPRRYGDSYDHERLLFSHRALILSGVGSLSDPGLRRIALTCEGSFVNPRHDQSALSAALRRAERVDSEFSARTLLALKPVEKTVQLPRLLKRKTPSSTKLPLLGPVSQIPGNEGEQPGVMLWPLIGNPPPDRNLSVFPGRRRIVEPVSSVARLPAIVSKC